MAWRSTCCGGKADEYKKKEDWTNLTATLEQLALLQPNFITFWKFQSWNVSYNVSVQFDDYRDRYYYVREGIQFLEQGVEKNRENRDIPQLLWDLGWFVGQKIGRADENVQYRRLFKADDEYHGDEPPPGSDERDNWLVSKKEYLNGIAAIQDRGKSLGKKSEKIYYSSPAKSQMSYAEAIEKEGEFQKGQDAWVVAGKDWADFGDRWIEHSTGRMLQLGHEGELAEVVEGLAEELDNMVPGLRDKMTEEKRAKLSDEERAALDKPRDERDGVEFELAYKAEQTIQVGDLELVNRIAEVEPDLRKQASLLASRLADERTNLIFTQRYKTDANYDYWALRAEFEQTDVAVEARRKMFEAKQAYDDNQDRETAKRLYEEGFQKWRELVDTYPELLDRDGVTGDDILVFIIEYRRVLKAGDETIADDFPLWEVIENFDAEMDFEDELRDREQRMKSKGLDGNADRPSDETDANDPAEPDDEASGESSNDEGEVAADEESKSDAASNSTSPEEGEPADIEAAADEATEDASP